MILFFSITGLLNGIGALFLGFLALFKRSKSNLHRIFALLNLAIAIWAFSYWRWLLADTYFNALFWARMLSFGSTLIPIFFLHWILLLVGVSQRKRLLLVLGYLMTVLFLSFNFSPLFVKTVEPTFGFPFWPKPGILYHFYIIFSYILLLGYGVYQLFVAYHKAEGHQRAQMKYIFLGLAIAAPAGFSNFPLWYNINFPPYLNIFVLTYMSCYAYAILRYRLMDIRVVLGRSAVYLLSFGAVVGLAFGMAFLYSRLTFPIPVNITYPAILIIGILLFQPIFRFFERLASKYFYYTFYSYQTVLTSLGKRLTEVLELDKLTSLITNTLINTMKLDKTGILLREPETGDYKIQKILGFKEENGISLVRDNFLTLYLEKTKKPLVYEELTFAIRDNQDEKERANLEKLQSNMKRIEANICLPLFREDKITGIIVLGNKISGDPYSQQDLELLISLSNQASISLENARLYQIVQDLSQNLEQKVKEQTKDIQALSEMKSEFLKVVSHQLNTPASIINSLSSMLAEGSVKKEKQPEFIKNLYLSSERLITILDDILVAQGLVGGVQKVNISPSKIDEIVEQEVHRFKSRAEIQGIKVSFRKLKEVFPITLVDPEMIQRAIRRLIDNAILYTPALASQEAGQAKEGGKVEVSLDLKKDNNKEFIEISVKDNGIGLDEEDKKTLFNLFHRGKRATSIHPNGSGLGLFIVKNFIEAHQGKIEVKSEGKDKGSTFVITLPVITEV